MPAWFIWAVVVSGGSAIYWWKKSHPGQSLNPMPPTNNDVAQNDVQPRASSKP